MNISDAIAVFNHNLDCGNMSWDTLAEAAAVGVKSLQAWEKVQKELTDLIEQHGHDSVAIGLTIALSVIEKQLKEVK